MCVHTFSLKSFKIGYFGWLYFAPSHIIGWTLWIVFVGLNFGVISIFEIKKVNKLKENEN